MCDQQRLRPACVYAQSCHSLCWSLEYSMSLMLLTKPGLEFLSLTGGCTGSSGYICQNATLLEITCRGSCMVVGTQHRTKRFQFLNVYSDANKIKDVKNRNYLIYTRTSMKIFAGEPIFSCADIS